MQKSIFNITLLVKNYDEAINFYVDRLNFDLIEDTKLSPTKRWVRVSPKGTEGACLLLAQATSQEQVDQIGNQSGGRVFLFLSTDDIQRDLVNLNKNDIQIISPLREEPYGKVLVFADLYGNKWDLIQSND